MTKNFSQTAAFIWSVADLLRGSLESLEYKHIVLSPIFLKFISDNFEKRKHELIDADQEKYINLVQAYIKKNVFYLLEDRS